MDDLRLWFVFLGMATVTVFVLNPTDPMLAAGPFTVLPVTTTGFLAMIVATVFDGRWQREMRRRMSRRIAQEPRPGPPSIHVGLCYIVSMAMQCLVIFSMNESSDLPPWTAAWAFLVLTLASELSILLAWKIAVETTRQLRTAATI